MNERGAYGAGTIDMLDSGKWRGRISLGVDPATGKRVRRTVTGRTRAEAAKLIREAIREWEQATEAATATNKTFGDAKADWLDRLEERVAAGKMKPTTAAYYRHMVVKSEALDAKRLDRLSRPDIRAWVKTLEGSPSARRGAVVAVKQVLGHAVDLGWTPKNVALGVETPVATPVRSIVAATQADIDALAANSPEPYRTLWILLGQTGMRVGEARALRWRDVDLKRRALWIEEGKTAASRRVIALTDTAAKVLGWLEPGQPDDFVFQNEVGSPLDKSKTNRVFRDARPRPELTPHSLRHSVGTRLLESGVPPHVVAAILGHSDASVTLSTYAHSVSRLEADAMRNLE